MAEEIHIITKIYGISKLHDFTLRASKLRYYDLVEKEKMLNSQAKGSIRI